MKNLLLCAILLFCFAESHAQRDFYEQELLNLGDLSRLSHYQSGEMDQLPAMTAPAVMTMALVESILSLEKKKRIWSSPTSRGQGLWNRIWTPTPTTDTVKFYFDGEKKPRIVIPFIELFTGKTFPFLAPLSGNQIGGYYCYLPIPYEKSLKIVYVGKELRFHQTQYRTLRKEGQVTSYTPELVRAHESTLDRVAATWNKKRAPLLDYGNGVKEKKISLVLKPGVEESLFSLSSGGRVVGIQLDAGNIAQAYRKIMLTARWDNEEKNAIDLPLHDFFGFAFGRPAMQSIILGSNRQKLYSWLPMPFDQSADIKLKFDPGTGSDDLLVTGSVFYTNEKRNPAIEGKLYVQSRRLYNIPSESHHTIADVKGKGHFMGTVLMAQGLEEGHTRFFEGDDRATIDGVLKLHGTGSEDYFNGGWYAVMDRWDRGLSLPIHGSLDYNLMSARTGGYRFYLNDKLNFNQSFQLTIEHQPDAKEYVKADYTSVAFFYADKPRFDNTPILINNQVKRVPRRDALTAQGMMYTLYWLASASYEDPSIVFSMKKSDKWFAQIDSDAVPVAQIFLNNLDNGRYKVQMEYGKSEDPGLFSIWQRSRRVSDWISSNKDMPSSGTKTVDIGEIDITDEIKTITIRKNADDTSVRIVSFHFGKID